MSRFDWETRLTRRADTARLRREHWQRKAEDARTVPTVPGILEQTLERYRGVAAQIAADRRP